MQSINYMYMSFYNCTAIYNLLKTLHLPTIDWTSGRLKLSVIGSAILIIPNGHEVLTICLGKCPYEFTVEEMEAFWLAAGSHIEGIYRFVLNQHKEIG